MKIFYGTVYGFFVLLLVGIAGLFLVSLLPIPGNIQIKIVKSGSMDPAMPTGSVALIQPFSSYEVGDVITFGEDTLTRVPTTHRVVGIRMEGEQMYFTTKGDANEEVDPEETTLASVIGKVVWSVPYVGYILDFAKQPKGFALLIGIPAALVILDEISVIWSEIGKYRRRRKDKQVQEISITDNEPVRAVVEDIRVSALQAAGIRRIVH